MRPRRRAMALGLAVGLAYVVAVAVGTRGMFGPRAPLLDGIAPPVAYRWVSPPPALAAGNKPPQPEQHFTVSLGAHGSKAEVLSTQDLQAVLVLTPGAIAPKAGASSVDVTVTALAPATLGPPPSGLTIAGNVYRFTAQYAGDGSAELRHAAQLALEYPAIASAGHVTHTLIWSADGRGWQKLTTQDNRQGQIAGGRVTALGYVAVVVPRSEADGLLPSVSPSSGGGHGAGGAGGAGGGGFPLVAVIAAAAAIVVLAGAILLRRRTSRRAGAHRRPSRRRDWR
jgi:hypothetical protein